ncbi:Fyn-Binding Protein 2 [Manis pentadactyla]|nr:Fyn-Binding Protein 2 [Manis pentadactyla]
MEEEAIRSFKELRAKFQKLDAPSLPGPIKFAAGFSQKRDIGTIQSTRILANGKPLSSNHNQPPQNCSSDELQPHKPPKMKLSQRSRIQKFSNSPGPPERSTGFAVNSQTGSLLLDTNQPNAEKKVMAANSFRDKLWNWEQVSSQKSELSSAVLPASCGSRAFHLEEQKSTGLTLKEPRKRLDKEGGQTLPPQRHLMAQRKSPDLSKDPTFLLSQKGRKALGNPSPKKSPAGSPCQPIYERELTSQAPEKQLEDRHHQLLKTKPLPSVGSLGPPPTKPPRPPGVKLQAFQRRAAAPPETHGEAAVEDGYLPAEGIEFEEPHNYEATISYPRHSGTSINLCAVKEIADSTYEVEIEELQKPWKTFLHQELSPKHEDKKVEEKEPCELEPQKTEKDLRSNHLVEVDGSDRTPGRIQMIEAHRGRRSMLARKQEAATDVIQTKACTPNLELARHSQGLCEYVKALEVTKETPGQEVCKPGSTSEETYDDVEYPRRQGPKSDFSNSFASENEENSEEMYEDVYKTKSNYSTIDLDGKQTLKRLQKFFKKEKDRFKMRKTKSKENVSSSFSTSLPNLELRSPEILIYDDVDISEKESKEEDKLKTWKPKFLMLREKKEKKGEESERNFFRTKKQNLEKTRMKREEKLFRERFEYDKDITVINTAVVCSSNSRNGIFDLPITPGEEVEVIDITKEDLVICRNSKGKYGYVLIEHLDFKHQGWLP